MPPDPARDTRLIDALLGARALDGDEQMKGFAADATRDGRGRGRADDAGRTRRGDGSGWRSAAAEARSRRAETSPSPRRTSASAQRRRGAVRTASCAGEHAATTSPDAARRAPMFRAADKTQEWAENNWWHLTPAEQHRIADRAEPALARPREARSAAPFLSPSLGLATSNFAEAMCALAVIDLPFVVPTARATSPTGRA